MKNIFLLSVAICSSHFVNAGEDIDGSGQHYAIISDEFSADVPVGKCLVVGEIVESTYDFITGASEQIPLVGGLVSTLDRKKTSTTNSEGKFSLLLDSKDTSLFFFKKEYQEIVIWKYIFKSQHKVTINFYPGMNRSMMVVDKPVIYLYSDKEIIAEIQFTCKGDLTFTYPEYNEKWEVTVNQNKITETKSNKSYPYLFWEAQTNDLNFQFDLMAGLDLSMDGFIISTDSIVTFLENSLSALGLNSTEQTDFITFWAPKMIEKPFALVQFFVDDLYASKISEMNITPKPDAMRRVFMLYQPLETSEIVIQVMPQKLNSFARTGFTVLEWGGSEVTTAKINP